MILNHGQKPQSDIGTESTYENYYRKQWNVEYFNDPLNTLTVYKQKIRDTILDQIMKYGKVEWFIGVVIKNDLYHNGELIRRAGIPCIGTRNSATHMRNFNKHYQRTYSKILNEFVESNFYNERWVVDKVLYIYVQVKHKEDIEKNTEPLNE